MKRAFVLALLMAAGSLSLALTAQQPAAGAGQPPAAKVIEVEKLKDNLFVLRGSGGGGNTAVFVTSGGVVVVDTKNPGWGQPILNSIRKLTDKPVTTIINTHTHGDHVSGNVEFPATVDVVAHENTKANMEKMATPTGTAPPATPTNIFTVNSGRGMAKRTFTDRMSIGRGNDQIDLYYFGRGHTNGDAWVVFPALRVMHAGDIFLGKRHPFLDANNGGSGVAIPDTLARAFDGVKNVDTVITGHSTLMTMQDLKEFADFNRDFLMAVQEGKKAGKSVDEIAGRWKIPARYAGYTTPDATPLKSNVRVIFDELK